MHKKCESNKENVKIMGLTCVILHNICIDKGDLVPRKIDLTYNVASNRRESNQLGDLLDLTDSNVKNFKTGQAVAVKVRVKITSILVGKRGVLIFDQGKIPN